MKTLVLYVFHIYNNRVQYFIDNAIFYDKNIDFIMISNDKNNKFEVPYYVKTMYRDNIGFDFGGWSDALLSNDLYKKYDHFIFANSSIIGPFLHPNTNEKWVYAYLNGLTDNIKLFGSTINTCRTPTTKSHVQSYIFCMNKETLEYLISCGIFSMTVYENHIHGAVDNREIPMSLFLLKKGWNIGSLLPYYKDVDFTFSNKTPEQYNIEWLDDIMCLRYRNYLWTDNQLIFIKGNRMGC